jgi:1-aminocyclopropane-1-carboxylate deaminase
MEAKLNLTIPSPVIALEHPLLTEKGIELHVKRDDLIHPEISGNKWRKLFLNIEKYYDGKYDKLLTFGGAFSNHIAATAKAGKLLGIPTIGVIRGEELNAHSNETLKQAHADGMELVFISRAEYRLRAENDYKNELRSQFGNVLIVNEGGANFYGVLGCTKIISELEQENYQGIYLAAGTGTTTAGLLMSGINSEIHAVAALKNGGFLEESIAHLLTYAGIPSDLIPEQMNPLKLQTEYHFGGYGKFTDELLDFMLDIYATTGLKLDQVYSAKAFYALWDQVKSDYWPGGSQLLFIHTGGLQGIRTIQNQLNYSND